MVAAAHGAPACQYWAAMPLPKTPNGAARANATLRGLPDSNRASSWRLAARPSQPSGSIGPDAAIYAAFDAARLAGPKVSTGSPRAIRATRSPPRHCGLSESGPGLRKSLACFAGAATFATPLALAPSKGRFVQNQCLTPQRVLDRSPRSSANLLRQPVLCWPCVRKFSLFSRVVAARRFTASRADVAKIALLRPSLSKPRDFASLVTRFKPLISLIVV
jgi:hypothetical protein